MKEMVLGLAAVLLLALSALPVESADPKQAARAFLAKLTWTGQAGIRIKSGLVVHIDPYKVAKPEKADLILITHSHKDHYSVDDINKIKKDASVLVVPKELEKCGLAADVRAIEPGQTMEVKGIEIRAVPAYNLNKQFHPKANGWVGYILKVDGVTVYHAGDTDLIPEMRELKGIDLALLPAGGTYTMDPAEAAEAARAIGAGITVPMHILRTTDLQEFKDLYLGEARILSVQG